MADTKSFFERLTGSVRIQNDNTGKETPIEPVVEPVAEIVAERPPVERKALPVRRKKIADDDAGDVSSVDAGVVEPAPEPVQEPVKESIPAVAPPPRARVEEPAEEEPEGQLTVDIYDDGDMIVIQSTVAGVNPEDLDLSVTNDMVTLKGRRRRSATIREESYYYKELYWGAFSRSVILPEEVEADEAEAALKNGLLTVRLPKKNKQVMKKIRVKMD